MIDGHLESEGHVGACSRFPSSKERPGDAIGPGAAGRKRWGCAAQGGSSERCRIERR